jgi:quercetin dioxygenase-like cupin family protein
VLEGEFEFVCGGETVRGGPGTFVHAPRGLPHRYKNVGAATGRILFTFTPAGIEAFFGELVTQNERSREATAAVARKYGITMVW